MLNYLRRNALTLALIVLVMVTSGPEMAQAVDEFIDGNIIFSGPGQDEARDIHTTSTNGGMRFYTASNLTGVPSGAAIQFFGNSSTGFPGQAFIDSGAHNNAAVIFRTATTGATITERMRISSDGNVGIGTNNPRSALHVAGNYIQFPTTGSVPPAADCNEFAEIGRVILQTSTGSGTPVLWVCDDTSPGIPITIQWTSPVPPF
jgi:hypothetical protein